MAQSLNLINVLKKGLSEDLKNILTEELVKDEVKKYEAKVRDLIKPLVERIVLEGVENIQHYETLKNELVISIHWIEKESKDVPVQ